MKRVIEFVVMLVVLMATATSGYAREGTAEIANVVGGRARCFAASVLMRDFNYKILLSCRDLTYPINSGAFNYTIWVREEGSDNPRSLGDVGIGKREFSIDKPFTSYFVTEERSSGPRAPSDRIIMEGQVRSIGILEGGQTNTGSTSVDEEVGNFGLSNITTTPIPTGTVNSQQQADGTSGALTALKIVGGVVLIGVLLVVVIALVSASRRRPIDL